MTNEIGTVRNINIYGDSVFTTAIEKGDSVDILEEVFSSHCQDIVYKEMGMEEDKEKGVFKRTFNIPYGIFSGLYELVDFLEAIR